ncbi:hypothetical protein AB0D57_02610 [Streptomyces sp. NPDC048275]|uniref:hypothetical protein n=1 Tax=Streptomyces sp. NPDC048275 TaxID=3155629 RepID=UPI0033F271BB
MEAFGNCPEPGPDARLAHHEEDTCGWCVQPREAHAKVRQLPTVDGKRSLAPWMVPAGLLLRPAQVDK